MSPDEITTLLADRMGMDLAPELAGKLAGYLELLLRWNGKTNLSAVREPEAMVLRHFGESLQCARALPSSVRTLLDFGSGAGFPGAVCALARPELAVTLAESQQKKAAFLHELCRTLALTTKVHAGRAATLPASLRFDAVTLRAVDRMVEATVEARARVVRGGWLIVMTTSEGLRQLVPELPGMAWRSPVPMRGTERGILALGRVLREEAEAV